MKERKLNILVIFAVLFSVLFTETSFAQFDIPPKPSKQSEQTSVYDYINLLSPSQKTSLEKKLIGYADSTSTQIVVAIIATTKGEDISLLGAKWGQKWGIGQADEDNGIFILLAKDDRKIDMNTGYGIEYRVTDLMAERIINRIMIPEFKNENYYIGLDKGADALFAALKGEFKEDRDFSDNGFGKILPFIIIIIILLIIFRRKNNGKGGRGGGSLLDVIILSNMGRTGGYSGGSFGGGGGFGGGFGGGGFGGGGASGGW